MVNSTQKTGVSRKSASRGEGRNSAAAADLPLGLCFELERVAVKGRLAAYDLLQDLLKDRKLELTRAGFCRYGAGELSAEALSSLLKDLGGARLSADKLADELSRALEMFYSSDEARLEPALGELLESAPATVPLVAVSGLPETQATVLIERLGLAERNVRLFAQGETPLPFSGADGWMQMLKDLEWPAARMVALVSSNDALRGALVAGLCCVAAPDEFTGFQDFGGADLVLDAIDKEAVDGLRPLLHWRSA